MWSKSSRSSSPSAMSGLLSPQRSRFRPPKTGGLINSFPSSGVRGILVAGPAGIGRSKGVVRAFEAHVRGTVGAASGRPLGGGSCAGADAGSPHGDTRGGCRFAVCAGCAASGRPRFVGHHGPAAGWCHGRRRGPLVASWSPPARTTPAELRGGVPMACVPACRWPVPAGCGHHRDAVRGGPVRGRAQRRGSASAADRNRDRGGGDRPGHVHVSSRARIASRDLTGYGARLSAGAGADPRVPERNAGAEHGLDRGELRGCSSTLQRRRRHARGALPR